MSTNGFSHEALLYAGEDGFLGGTLPFVCSALEAEEPVLVMVGAAKIDALREALNGQAPDVEFANMEEVGSNPARIIPAWSEFATERAAPGRCLWGIGEPIWAGRSPAELIECQRHESLLNLAFAEAPAFRLLCPYDTEALAPDVIEEAHCSHHSIVDDEGHRMSTTYRGIELSGAPFAVPLPDPPVEPAELRFEAATLDRLRGFVGSHAEDAGMTRVRAYDLVLAVNEVATNSVRHAGGGGVARVWDNGGAVVCEVEDDGHVDLPLAGRERPDHERVGGHGLWLVNQLCDLAQIRS
ncbi:MAG: sensor histidine kinase, partial [Actinomycetota bacterium]|nr:sensor histidine kinase [Actinomycetota bacterium]